MGYEEKATQKQRLLEALKNGEKVCQIDLNYYMKLRDDEENAFFPRIYKRKYVDAIADLGIANLPARIFGLKKDGYKIKTEKVAVDGRWCKTFYCVYSLDTDEK